MIMKKAAGVLLALLMVPGLAACSTQKQEPVAEEGFKPSMTAGSNTALQ